MTNLGRLITAMVTPFNDDFSLNIDETIKLANYLVDNGTDTVLLAGTTGESPTLTHNEEYSIFKEVSRSLAGKAKVMAGTGSNCTQTAIESTQAAEKCGVDSILQVVPYYNKPSQEGMYQHFKAVADSTSLPILLYNIPGRTGINMEPETMARLADIDNIIGVKEAAGSVDQVKAIRQETPDDFLIYSGDDGLTLDFMEAGACGVVSVAAHCVGLEIQSMMSAFVDGDQEKARSIQDRLNRLFDVLFITSNPVPVKVALSLMGHAVGPTRLPLVSATPDEISKIQDVLNSVVIPAS
ncbi:4-hydroxy-tetrahydrodipicolinate synthase [Candidatus Marinamargulisbacteria bacterium SCGC AG-410-N11]|nr:4-hydroxy-tetrahydrodipicolinate synthase [Candidatus Marinamargulisbacteria bacterium SCGC AG-410-N11]